MGSCDVFAQASSSTSAPGGFECGSGRRDARIIRAKLLGSLQRQVGVVPLSPLHVREGDADERVWQRRVPARGE
jgi:hypothetical protein